MTTATGDTLQMNYDVLRRISSVSSNMCAKEHYYEDISGRTIIRQHSLLFAALLHYSYKKQRKGSAYDRISNCTIAARKGNVTGSTCGASPNQRQRCGHVRAGQTITVTEHGGPPVPGLWRHD